MRRRELASHLDELLRLGEYEDTSVNGLQFEGRDEVERVALAVDACGAVFREAIEWEADMLVVHHGLIWGEVKSIEGNLKARLELLFSGELSLYAAHLPLDAHPTLGNNAQLIKILGIEAGGRAGEHRGQKIGYWGELKKRVGIDEFARKLEDRLGTECLALGFGGRVKKVAVVSGSGWRAVYEAKELGYDTLLTGESSHSAYTLAEELGVNLVFAGHYATERPGLLALGEHLKQKFNLETSFVEHSTGL